MTIQSYRLQLHAVDPFEYLDHVLKRIPNTKKSKLRELLPGKWKKTN